MSIHWYLQKSSLMCIWVEHRAGLYEKFMRDPKVYINNLSPQICLWIKTINRRSLCLKIFHDFIQKIFHMLHPNMNSINVQFKRQWNANYLFLKMITRFLCLSQLYTHYITLMILWSKIFLLPLICNWKEHPLTLYCHELITIALFVMWIIIRPFLFSKRFLSC